MIPLNSLDRFLEAQEDDYQKALGEIKRGMKTGHWMWYIFPQIDGLGRSAIAKFFAVSDRAEAERYLSHPVLGRRLLEISSELLKLKTSNPVQIFGGIDSMKLRSSMTLFMLMKEASPVFQEVLNKFFGGAPDPLTIQILDK